MEAVMEAVVALCDLAQHWAQDMHDSHACWSSAALNVFT